MVALGCSRVVLIVLPLTAFATYLQTLIRCRNQYVKEAQAPRDICSELNKDEPDVVSKDEDCVESLSEISVYGGCTEKGRAIFIQGFSLLCVQLILLVGARLMFFKRVLGIQLVDTPSWQRPCPTWCCVGTMGLSGCIGALAMLPMAIIKLNRPLNVLLHTFAATVVFVSLTILEITDLIMQHKARETIMQHKTGVCVMLHVWNYFFIIGGLVCLLVYWTARSIPMPSLYWSEWIAATMPFFYVFTWTYQALVYHQHHDAASGLPSTVKRVGAPVYAAGIYSGLHCRYLEEIKFGVYNQGIVPFMHVISFMSSCKHIVRTFQTLQLLQQSPQNLKWLCRVDRIWRQSSSPFRISQHHWDNFLQLLQCFPWNLKRFCKVDRSDMAPKAAKSGAGSNKHCI